MSRKIVLDSLELSFILIQMNRNVLLSEPDSIYRDIIKSILTKSGYNCFCAVEENDILKSIDEDGIEIAIIDVQIVKTAKENILEKIKKKSSIPVILCTDDDVSKYLDIVLKYKIMQVLNKPIKASELLLVLDKNLNLNKNNLFGLQNYLPGLEKTHIKEIRSSSQVKEVIKGIIDITNDNVYSADKRMEIYLVLQEILTNAIYHSHGFSAEKKEGIPVDLPEPYKVVVEYGVVNDKVGISVRDFCGKLCHDKIIEPLYAAYKQHIMLEDSFEKGEDITDMVTLDGRGLDLIRKLTGEHYFITEPDKSTEIILIYDGTFETDSSYSGIRIFELSDN